MEYERVLKHEMIAIQTIQMVEVHYVLSSQDGLEMLIVPQFDNYVEIA